MKQDKEMFAENEIKSYRLLTIHSRLMHDGIIRKKDIAQEFGVSERSIQRDLEVLRSYYAEQLPPQELLYDSKKRGFRLIKNEQEFLTDSEVLAVCKILLESRSLPRDDMHRILEKLVDHAVLEESKPVIKDLLANEKFHYIPPHHNKHILPDIWALGQAVRQQRIIEVLYKKPTKDQPVARKLKPVGLMFSGFYFYLTAFQIREDEETQESCPANTDTCSPIIYRVDRIEKLTVTDEHFRIPYKDRFEEGQFRKRVQFMQGGKLQKVKFRFKGPAIDTVLDRLPTAQILSHDENGYIISAEVFGRGIDIWLRGRGDEVELLEDECNRPR